MNSKTMDVAFAKRLCNGRSIENVRQHDVDDTRPIRVRIINAASMANYLVQFGEIEVCH
jgi:hypothetical protein